MMGRAHHKSILSGRHCMLVAVEYGFCRGCRALEKCSVVDSKGFKRVATMPPLHTLVFRRTYDRTRARRLCGTESDPKCGGEEHGGDVGARINDRIGESRYALLHMSPSAVSRRHAQSCAAGGLARATSTLL